MRPILILTILALSTAACATQKSTQRPVVVRRAPVVVVEQPAAPVATATSASAAAVETVAPATAKPSPSATAFEKNPVPGSAREYINRYSSTDAMSK